MILLTAAGSRTQRQILPHLRRAGATVRAFGRTLDRQWFSEQGVTDIVPGNLLDREALSSAMRGVETVVHLGPALNADETIMGRFVIDAARNSGVSRFIYISVIHSQIEYLLNHQAKRLVEDYLISSRLSFTILQPQHYFQSVDIGRALETGVVALPYSVERSLGFVDMADLGEVAARIVTEPGHDFATYQISSDEHLSGNDIAALLSTKTGRSIRAERIPLDAFVAMVAPHCAGVGGNVDASADIATRLFSYYDRYGIRGNGRILEWLLGRDATPFESYIDRCIDEYQRQSAGGPH